MCGKHPKKKKTPDTNTPESKREIIIEKVNDDDDEGKKKNLNSGLIFQFHIPSFSFLCIFKEQKFDKKNEVLYFLLSIVRSFSTCNSNGLSNSAEKCYIIFLILSFFVGSFVIYFYFVVYHT